MEVEYPSVACTHCGYEAWRLSQDLMKLSFACSNCGQIYSEPSNTQTDEEDAAAIKTFFDKLGETLAEDLTEVFTEQLTPILLGNVIIGKKEDLGRYCRWCDPRVADETERMGLCGPHAINLLDERKRGLEVENRSLTVIWELIDSISSAPRAGNVFERAMEVMDYPAIIKEQNQKLKLENAEFLARLKDAREELRVLRDHVSREHVEAANAQINEIRSKVNPE
jgi:hypothetical protein